MSVTKIKKPVRQCSHCERWLRLDEIVYSSSYPDDVVTAHGTMRAGTKRDAARVWCSAACAKAHWAVR